MNNKITFPRLATLIADNSGRSKRFSEDFLREFFSLISESLESGESVKIKGLGTFRLSRVEARKSIDVTTGQPMEILGHSKVVFVPAKELADTVNSPFEAFTTIEIGDDVDIDSLIPKEEDVAEPISEDPEENNEFLPDDSVYNSEISLKPIPVSSSGSTYIEEEEIKIPKESHERGAAPMPVIDFQKEGTDISDESHDFIADSLTDLSEDELNEETLESHLEENSEIVEISKFSLMTDHDDYSDQVTPGELKDFEVNLSISKDFSEKDVTEKDNDVEMMEEGDEKKDAILESQPDAEVAIEAAELCMKGDGLTVIPTEKNDNSLEVAPDNVIEQSSEHSSDSFHSESQENIQEEVEEEDYNDDINRKNHKHPFFIWAGVAVLALILAVAIWYFISPDNFKIHTSQWITAIAGKNKLPSIKESSKSISEETEPKAMVADSLVSDTISAIATEETVPTAPSDEIVYDTIGTTRYLTTMAKSHYGNYNLWPYIYEENKTILGHPDRIRPGTPVVIPKLSKYGVDPNNNEDIEKAKKIGIEIYAKYGKKI